MDVGGGRTTGGEGDLPGGKRRRRRTAGDRNEVAGGPGLTTPEPKVTGTGLVAGLGVRGTGGVEDGPGDTGRGEIRRETWGRW